MAKAAKPTITSVKKPTRKKLATPRRGQPTAAARVVGSSYVRFGWHKTLTGDIKTAVQNVSSAADSMYMLQIERDRPIDSLSIRNGIFWEHRQLRDQSIVSTPAADHWDFFGTDEEAFKDYFKRIVKQHHSPREFQVHCFFENLRGREFFILPIEIDGAWVTVIGRIVPKNTPKYLKKVYLDRVVTDLAIADPLKEYREKRRTLIFDRLVSIFREGCIELGWMTSIRDFGLEDVLYHWQTGLVACTLSSEFLRRLKTLLFQRARLRSQDLDAIWANFEEDYNFDAYRQYLMSACARQCIAKSDYRIRMALEVPSEETGHACHLLRHETAADDLPDEKWDIFQRESHTCTVEISPDLLPILEKTPSLSSEVSVETPSASPQPSIPASSPQPTASSTLSKNSRPSHSYSPAAPNVHLEDESLYSPTSPAYGDGQNTEVNQPHHGVEGLDMLGAPLAMMQNEHVADAHHHAEENSNSQNIPHGDMSFSSYSQNAPVASMGHSDISRHMRYSQHTQVATMGQPDNLSPRIPGLGPVSTDGTGSFSLSRHVEDHHQSNMLESQTVLDASWGFASLPKSPAHEEEVNGVSSLLHQDGGGAVHQSQSLASAALENLESNHMGQETSLKRSLDLDEDYDEEEEVPSPKRLKSWHVPRSPGSL